jgi:hypothetical protein
MDESVLELIDKPRRVKIPITEIEKHDGWIESLKNEERTMKDSIVRCIDGKYTMDPERAKRILKFSFPETDSRFDATS